MTPDAIALRAQFPLLAANPDLHYLDSAATAQIHQAALEAVHRHETTRRANILRGTYALAEAASAAYDSARQTAARFLNARSAREVVFTSGATAAINLVAHSFGGTLDAGDVIVVSPAEHHSNFVPWQRLRDRAGIELKLLPLQPDGRIDLSAVAQALCKRCRLIAITHCSNVTGAVTDVATVVAAAKGVGARVLLDGAQAVQHGPVDVRSLGIDFYAFSGHKCFGPTGVGVLWARLELLDSMPPFMAGGGMVGQVSAERTTYAEPPRRFEAGTPPIAQAVGLAAALDWMMSLPWDIVGLSELDLAKRLLDGLAERAGVRVLGPVDMNDRMPIVSFDVAGVHPHDLTQVLDEDGLALRGGHHCAQPLMAALGVEACTRASIALYNTAVDVDALLAGLDRALRILK